MPTFPLPEGFNDNYTYLKHLVNEGWVERGFDKFPKEKQEIYRERINYELETIHAMGFDGYFLIVWVMVFVSLYFQLVEIIFAKVAFFLYLRKSVKIE